jgi:diguanylate cyclase (GGDEF)-like protein
MGQQYLFYDKRLDSVFILTTPKRTRKEKIDQMEKKIREQLLAGEHEFDAHHDKLTHLLNRSGFQKEATRILKKRPRQELGDASSLASSGNGICFIALDIDHFKRVNDSYGHQYGDAVLLAFAWRISEHLESILHSGKLEAIIGRPGGEEFEILISNLSGEDEAKTLAESFQTAIHRDRIPSDTQWPIIVQDQNLDGMSLPTERGVTASIGYTYRNNNNENLNVAKTYSLLRSESDSAVYRAKADGRDCVRNYSKIAREHGRVIEHLSEANIVAIDIGESVGVTRGQVFDVYLPSLAGGSPYLQKSDRGNKILGAYPRATAGRIQVFDAQKEISFCCVVDSGVAGHFPAGSRLCYVAHGNDTPLVGMPHTHSSPQGIPPSGLARTLDKLLQFRRPVLCLFALEKAAEGTSSEQEENTRLEGRHLSTFLRTVLPPETEFSILDENMVAAVVTAPLNPDELREYIFKCGELVSGSAETWLAVGAVHMDSIVPPPSIDEQNSLASDLGADGAQLIYLARVSLFVAQHTSSPSKRGSITIEFFDNETPSKAISTWRKLRKHDEAVVDYFRLREFGFSNTLFDNQGGLALIESKDDREARAAINALNNALKTANPTDQDVIRANLGLALAKAGRYMEAFDSFKQSHKFLVRRKSLSWVYRLSHAKSALESYKEDKASIARTTLFGLIDKALKAARPSQKMYVTWRCELELIVKSGKII